MRTISRLAPIGVGEAKGASAPCLYRAPRVVQQADFSVVSLKGNGRYNLICYDHSWSYTGRLNIRGIDANQSRSQHLIIGSTSPSSD